MTNREEQARQAYSLMQNGMTKAEACKQVGIGQSTYYSYAKKLGHVESRSAALKKARRAKPTAVIRPKLQIHHLPDLDDKPMGLKIEGSPRQVAEFLSSISGR